MPSLQEISFSSSLHNYERYLQEMEARSNIRIGKTQKVKVEKGFVGSAEKYAILRYKARRELGVSEFDEYKEKYIKWLQSKVILQYTEYLKSGEKDEMVCVSSSYVTIPNYEGTYPKRFCVKIGLGYYLKDETFLSYDGDVIYLGNVDGHRLCEDTEGKFSLMWTEVIFKEGQKYYRNTDNLDCIFWRRECIHKPYAMSMGFWQGEDGRYYKEGETPFYESSSLDGYHSQTGPLFVSSAKDATLCVGLELEKYEYQSMEKIKSMKKRGWRCETDGSVEGGEYITPILPLDNVDDAVDWIINTGEGIVDLMVNDRCGGHIHISKKGVSSKDLYDSIKGWRPLFWALYPERAKNSYSHKDADPNTHSVDVGIRKNTVEFRIFPGLDNERKLRFRLSLLKYIVDHPAKEKEESLQRILNCLELREILSIAYGSNIRRIQNFFSRVNDFYSIPEGDNIGEMVKSVATSIVEGKRQQLKDGVSISNEVII